MIEKDHGMTSQDLQTLAKIHGKGRVSPVMQYAIKNQDLMRVLDTEVGRELLQTGMGRMNELLNKAIEGEWTDEERIEYKVLRNIVGGWATKIVIWNNKINELKDGIK